MRLTLANPRGFCAGVDRAITVVEELLALVDPPVYVRHAIVHNRAVVDGLRDRGAVFVDEIADIPYGAVAVISAHGVGPQVFEQAAARRLRLFDGTCPLVTKVQLEVARHAREGRRVVIIGHRGHVEVEGLVGHYRNRYGDGAVVVENAAEAQAVAVPRPDAVAYVTQTTLAADQTRAIIDVLRRRFPAIIEPHGHTICYATTSRQDAVRRLAASCGLIVVIGSPNSSNSQRLREVAEAAGAQAVLIESPDALDRAMLAAFPAIGLTSSASAPENLVQAAVVRMRALFPRLTVEEIGAPENVSFRPPSTLRQFRSQSKTAKGVPSMQSENRDEADLAGVIRAAGRLAQQAQELVYDVGSVAEREVAMIATIAEDVRDRVIAAERLKQARDDEVLAGFRKSAHRVIDLGFDVAGTILTAATDALGAFAGARREKELRPLGAG